MRRRPEMTQDLSRVLGWAEPVKMKPGWKQIQKGYFEAPGQRRARHQRGIFASYSRADMNFMTTMGTGLLQAKLPDMDLSSCCVLF
jgi:hypothetical protein